MKLTRRLDALTPRHRSALAELATWGSRGSGAVAGVMESGFLRTLTMAGLVEEFLVEDCVDARRFRVTPAGHKFLAFVRPDQALARLVAREGGAA